VGIEFMMWYNEWIFAISGMKVRDSEKASDVTTQVYFGNRSGERLYDARWKSDLKAWKPRSLGILYHTPDTVVSIGGLRKHRAAIYEDLKDSNDSSCWSLAES